MKKSNSFFRYWICLSILIHQNKNSNVKMVPTNIGLFSKILQRTKAMIKTIKNRPDKLQFDK